MSLYLLKLISKVTGIAIVSLISMFNNVENIDVNNYNEYITEEVVEKFVEKPVENDSIEELPVQSYPQENVDNSINNDNVIDNSSNEVTDDTNLGEYVGMLTGYGADCYGCSGLGILYCSTREKTYHSLLDSIYYNDAEYGSVRILSADHRLFPCGTIIEFTNGMFEPTIGIVLDTGSGMIRATDEGWLLIDLAFEKEENLNSITNKNTKFVVKRLGW